MKKGVSTDETPKSVTATVRPLSRPAVCWNANPDPRRTIPSAARMSGMNSVEKIASKADEKLVHNTTMTKISHT